MSTALRVSNPIGGPADIRRFCKRVPLMYDMYRFTWDFYLLGFGGYDILLGADWLKRFRVVLYCETRTVYHIDDKGNPLVVYCKSPEDDGSFIFSLDASFDEL
ncbi:hypothetical protein RBK84_00440, partial [Pseudomonas aeruginosa]|uniref:hypothetical protein n=1 Tax=Pseudomonas aeruginosa TaxID=287 RepID=UPI0027D3FC55